MTPERGQQVKRFFTRRCRAASANDRPFSRTGAPATWALRREVEALLAQQESGFLMHTGCGRRGTYGQRARTSIR